MILQIPTKIEVKKIELELESVSRELSDMFDDKGVINAIYVAKDANGLKSEFSIDFRDSTEFTRILKNAKGKVMYD